MWCDLCGDEFDFFYVEECKDCKAIFCKGCGKKDERLCNDCKDVRDYRDEVE